MKKAIINYLAKNANGQIIFDVEDNFEMNYEEFIDIRNQLKDLEVIKENKLNPIIISYFIF